jgi:hypothetical protein
MQTNSIGTAPRPKFPFQTSVRLRTGESIEVTIQTPTYRQLCAFMEIAPVATSADIVECCANQPRGWSDLLTFESVRDLAASCFVLFIPIAVEAAHRDPIAAATMKSFMSIAREALEFEAAETAARDAVETALGTKPKV